MKVILATGIYPPEIGGPATYVRELAEQLHAKGMEVKVITYGPKDDTDEPWPVIRVPKMGPFIRWWRYRQALRRHADDADIIYAFSSISCGVPLLLSRLKGPKRVLRLGGDFFWERYTDRGGMLSLREYYKSHPILKKVMSVVLKSFDHIAFSTRFQQDIYHQHYKELPSSSVLENALPQNREQLHTKHDPFRLLFMGRLVAFKNLSALLQAVAKLPNVRLTLIGTGPQEKPLKKQASELLIDQRVTFLESAHGEEKLEVFKEYDMLVIPSLTEISPNTALEARTMGMPVLLTNQTGLSKQLTSGMTLAILREPNDIIRALAEAMSQYESLAAEASAPVEERSWQHIAVEHLDLFQTLV